MSHACDETRLALLEQAVTELKKSNERVEQIAADIAKHLGEQALHASSIRSLCRRMESAETKLEKGERRMDRIERDVTIQTVSRKTALGFLVFLVGLAGTIGGLIAALIPKS